MFLSQTVVLAHASSRQEALDYLLLGYEPIECSFGPNPVVGEWVLDHHGPLSEEEPVSVKAARLAEQGVRINKFVVTGPPDPDAIYAIGVLSGLFKADEEIAAAIAVTDTDPIGVDRLLQRRHVREVLFDLALGEPEPTLKNFYHALECARYFAPTELSDEDIDAAATYEEERIRKVMSSIEKTYTHTILLRWNRIGRDVWHRKAPLAVQYKPEYGIISVSGCTEKGAQRLGTPSVYDLLGASGLDSFYPIMDSVLGYQGSGGRPDIGGSPRGVRFEFEDAERVFEALEASILF